MNETEAFEAALSLIALHTEGRTDDMHALLSEGMAGEERSYVLLTLVVVASRFARLLLEFNGIDTDQAMPEWVRAVARSATDYRP